VIAGAVSGLVTAFFGAPDIGSERAGAEKSTRLPSIVAEAEQNQNGPNSLWKSRTPFFGGS
jgi:hypothetical protein